MIVQDISLKFLITWLWQRKEALLWLAALIWLGIENPAHHHYTLCPFSNLGITFCPGCGLGRSIGYLFRLNLEASFMSHPLGIPAVLLLLYRSVKVIMKRSEYKLSTI